MGHRVFTINEAWTIGDRNMIQEDLVKKTITLKTLDRIEGSEGNKDYFVIHEDRVRFCLKLDFSMNYMGQPTGFFVRIRMIPSAKIDLYNMENWFQSNFKANEVVKKLGNKSIKANHLTIGDERVSYVLVSEHKLSDYGDPKTKAGWDKLITALTKDFDDLGKRIVRSMGVFCKTQNKAQKVIQQSMKDYLLMYAPEDPETTKKATVTPIKKKGKKGKGITETTFKDAAEEILSDICGEPTTIEFADDGDPKITPKK